MEDFLNGRNKFGRNPQARAPDVLLELRKPLKDEIERLIQPHQTVSRVDPPFSTSELVVMATICSDMKYMHRRTILTWLIETFVFFKEQLLESWVASLDPITLSTDETGSFWVRNDLVDVFNAYDVPLVATTWRPGELTSSHDRSVRYCTTEVHCARAYLARHLEPPRKGTFRFLDLPAELRNSIYEMIAVFPEPATAVRYESIGGYGEDPSLVLKTTGFESLDLKVRTQDGPKVIGLPRDILQIALVCQQIKKEVIPLFYGGNTFSFSSLSVFRMFAESMSRNHICHLKRLHFLLEENDVIDHDADEMNLRAAVTILEDLLCLEEIQVTVPEQEWQDLAREFKGLGDETDVWEQYPDVPVLHTLAAFLAQAKTFKIISDIKDSEPRWDLQSFISARVAEIKEEEEQATADGKTRAYSPEL